MDTKFNKQQKQSKLSLALAESLLHDMVLSGPNLSVPVERSHFNQMNQQDYRPCTAAGQAEELTVPVSSVQSSRSVVDDFIARCQDLDFTQCDCLFGDCALCDPIMREFYPQEVGHCLVCDRQSLLESHPLPTNFFDDIDFSAPEPGFTKSRPVTSILESVDLALRNKNPFEEYPFDHTGWTSEAYASWTWQQLREELRRPSVKGFTDRTVPYLDQLLYEGLCRQQSPEEKTAFIHLWAFARLRVISTRVLKRKVSHGTRRSDRRSRDVPRLSPPRDYQVRDLPDDPPRVVDRSVTLTDYVFPGQAPRLIIGTIPIRTRDDLFAPDLQRIFLRNAPLFKQLIAPGAVLEDFQPMLVQKVLSDGNFRKRIDDVVLARLAASSPVLAPTIFAAAQPALPASGPPSFPRFFPGLSALCENPEDEAALERVLRKKFPGEFARPQRPLSHLPSLDETLAFQGLGSPGAVLQSGVLGDDPDLEYDTSTGISSCSSREDAPFYKKMDLSDAAILLDNVAALAVTINLLVNARTHAERAQIIYLYVRGLAYSDILEYVDDFLDRPQYQGPMDDFLAEGFALLGVANIFSVMLLPTTSFDFFHNRLVSLSRRSDGDTQLKQFWAAFRTLCVSIVECFKQQSINPLFSSGCTPDEVLLEAECLILYKNEVVGLTPNAKAGSMEKLRSRGLIPKWWTRSFTTSEYVDRLREVNDSIARILPLTRSESRPLFLAARSKINTVLVGSVNAMSVNSRRIQPLGVVLTGGAGSGKSNLMDLIIQTVGRKMDFATDASSTYAWQQNVNFQDGLTSTHWAIVADDIDHNSKNCAPGVLNHVDCIMQVVDNKPFPVESANVNEKGNNYARPALFLYATNFANMRLVGFSPHFPAIYRRLPMKLVVRPLPEFVTQGVLDPDKIGSNVDIHSIDILFFSEKTGDYEVKFKDLTTRMAVDQIYIHFRKNFDRQTNVVSRNGVTFCTFCSTAVTSAEEVCVNCKKDPRAPVGILQGPGMSKPMEDATVAAREARQLTGSIIESRLVPRLETLVGRAEGMADGPGKAAKTVTKAFLSFGDFIVNNAHYAVGLGAFITAVSIIMSQTQLQGRVNNSTQTAPIDFIKVSEVKPPSIPFKQVTFTKDELIDRIRSSHAILKGDKLFCHAHRVGHDMFAVSAHLVTDPVMTLEYRGISYRVLNTADTVFQLGRKDISILKVPGVPAAPNLFPMFWEDVDASYTTFDELALVGPDSIRTSDVTTVAFENNQGYSGHSVTYEIPTIRGDCGLPVIARVGNAYRIVALHHMLYPVRPPLRPREYASGVVLTRAELRLACAHLVGTLQGGTLLQTNFPNGIEPHDLGSPVKSELALALANGAEVTNLGHVPKTKQFSSSRSKCRNSIFYDQVEPWCRQDLGQPHYWQVPVMKGAMIDGRWHSGYQNIFQGYRNDASYAGLYYAILDYSAAFQDCDTSGFAALSLNESICGVESSIINPVNLSTSVGPPIGGSKRAHISHAGSVSPELAKHVAEIEEILDHDIIPIPLSSLSYKDEPIKFSKQAKRDVRTINCLPAAYNLVLKQYMAPIKAFMRANPFVTESMVGIDMTRDGGEHIRNRFSVCNPDLRNIVEGDFRKMDKMINGSMAWACVEVFRKIASIIGVDPDRVALLVWSTFSVIYSIQGDLFQVGAANPSGSDITVEVNAIVNAVVQRAAWAAYHGVTVSLADYRAGTAHPRAYRDENALVTFGDDFLIAHPYKLDLVRLMGCFSQFGMDVTDGQKAEKPIYRSLFECTFLKRSFIEVDGFVRCGLGLPSIYRMLMIAKPTKLSTREHAAICLEEAMREVFLNSRLDFGMWRGRLRGLADEHKLWSSRYLQLLDHEGYESMWMNRTFTVWGVQPLGAESPKTYPSSDEALSPDGEFQSAKMSTSLQMTSAMGDASAASELLSTTGNIGDISSSTVTLTDTTYGSMVAGGTPSDLEHASGNIVSLTEPVVAGSAGLNRMDQAMADVSYDDFLHRNVQIGQWAEFVSVGTKMTLKPWVAWSTQPTVADKLANFNYIHGSMVVTGKFMAPPLCSGLAVVSFVPTYEDSVHKIPAEAYRIVFPHVVIDMSTSSDFVVTLPWICASNWGNLNDNLYALSWHMTVSVLTGLTTAVPSGCVSGVLRVFARPGDDFALSGAQFQSGRLGGRGNSYGTPVSVKKPANTGTGINIAQPNKTVQEQVTEKSMGIFGAKASSVVSTVGTVAMAGGKIPYIGPYVAAAGVALKGASAWMEWLGFTRKTQFQPLEETRVLGLSNVMNCDGPDTSHIAALFRENALSIDPAINGAMSGIDETSLAFINSRYTHLGTITFQVGDVAVHDYLIPVTPCMYVQENETFLPTTAGYTGGRFTYWRGDIKYLFYPVVSAAHHGALQFAWQPVPTSDSITTDLTNVSLNTSVDIGAAQPIEIVVGYNNDNPMCFTDFYQLSSDISVADYSTINGYLRVRNQMPIVGSICGQTIDVHVFQAAGDNMQFGGPTDIISIDGELLEFGNDLTLGSCFQAATIGAGGQHIVSVTLVPSSGDYPINELLCGERIESLRALIQKPSIIGLDEVDAQAYYLSHSPFRSEDSSAVNYFTYFATQFLAFAGSIRYKVLISRDSIELGNSPVGIGPMQVVPAFVPGFSVGGGDPLAEFNPSVTDLTLGVETTVPYYFNELYVAAYKEVELKDAMVWRGNFGPPSYCRGLVYRSAGPDARLTFYRAPNRWTREFAPQGTTIWTEFTQDGGPDLAERKAVTEKTVKKEITLEQYRARTGRKAFKVPKFRKNTDGTIQSVTGQPLNVN